jgi:hypothetical protein
MRRDAKLEGTMTLCDPRSIGAPDRPSSREVATAWARGFEKPTNCGAKGDIKGESLYAQAGWSCNPLLNESLKATVLLDLYAIFL